MPSYSSVENEEKPFWGRKTMQCMRYEYMIKFVFACVCVAGERVRAREAMRNV